MIAHHTRVSRLKQRDLLQTCADSMLPKEEGDILSGEAHGQMKRSTKRFQLQPMAPAGPRSANSGSQCTRAGACHTARPDFRSCSTPVNCSREPFEANAKSESSEWFPESGDAPACGSKSWHFGKSDLRFQTLVVHSVRSKSRKITSG